MNLRPVVAMLVAAAALAQTPPSPYHDDPDHPANRLFRAIYVVELVPAVVATALPAEHGDPTAFFVAGWYFGKREGTERDRRTFGGDGRQLPREQFTAAEAAAFAADLGALDGDVLTSVRREPRLAIYLQHDLLRLLQRLLDTDSNAELLRPLRAAAERLALPAATLRDPALATFSPTQLSPHLVDVTIDDLVEIDRESSRLFDAEYTQLWSRVWIAVPKRAEATTRTLLEDLAGATRDTLPPVPLGTTGVLAQGIVALDDRAQPCATDLVVDLRIQRFANRDPLHADNPTTTRDGVDFLQWLLPRAAVRAAGHGELGLAAFRRIAMEQDELFRDYGTLKHTTYAAQCSLCHRRSNTPDSELAGFSALRPSARPRVAEPDGRKRLAEVEFARFLARLPTAR